MKASNEMSDERKELPLAVDGNQNIVTINKLEAQIHDHDQEIERVCGAHYRSFIDCIRELLQIRPNAENLKRDTIDLNSKLIESTDIIHRKADELIKARRILVNSSSSIDLLNKCLTVLEQYSRFNHQLEERKFFPALKTLEALERDHLPSVSSYRFAQSMCREIPKFRVIIRDASTKDLNDFLEGLLVESQRIGEIVLKSAAKQQNFDDYEQMFARDKSIEDLTSSKDISGKPHALGLIDFSPVYRGLHIFSNLGFRCQFDEYYKEQRQKQSRLAFSPPANMSKSISAYNDYFCSVTGFFVIEDHLMGTTKDFVQSEYLNGLWQNAVQSMSVALKQHVKLCQDPTLMLNIKKLMILFIFTIRNYGHNTEQLTQVLITIREQYNEILMNQWQDRFEKIFRLDSYHPLEVQNHEEYMQVVGALSFFETDSVNFPKKFPFSLFVPKVYEEVRAFIEQSLKFSQDINSCQVDVENMVRKSTNQLLTKTLGSCLTKLINNPDLKLLQLIQITINTNYLEDAMQFLDDHITYQISKSTFSELDPTGSTNSQVKLQGKSTFKDARADAEAQIYKKLNDQIDEFLSLADYEWCLSEATGKASSFILDLIAWLKSTFQAFTNLPQRVAQGACMSACKHIAQSLRDQLLSDDVKSLSQGSLEQFNLDLIQCENFAGSEPVGGFREGDLQMAFAELRQLCDLFLYEDYAKYMSDMGKQQNKYLRVTTMTALTVVDKLREYDRKKTVFALKKTDKQKLRDTFAKNLRQVQQQQNQQNQQYQQQS